MSNESEFRIDVGVLYRRYFREILQEEVFSGRPIRWVEHKRWLDSTFRVRGPNQDVGAIATRLQEYARALGAP